MAKKKENIRISGHVVDAKMGRGVTGLQVETWDKDQIYDDAVGSAVTDEQGVFQMQFDKSHL